MYLFIILKFWKIGKSLIKSFVNIHKTKPFELENMKGIYKKTNKRTCRQGMITYWIAKIYINWIKLKNIKNTVSRHKEINNKIRITKHVNTANKNRTLQCRLRQKLCLYLPWFPWHTMPPNRSKSKKYCFTKKSRNN